MLSSVDNIITLLTGIENSFILVLLDFKNSYSFLFNMRIIEMPSNSNMNLYLNLKNEQYIFMKIQRKSIIKHKH